MDDIEKLKDKVEKDPSSTLFVPLAEKYRQAGQLDDAIEVLKRGIDNQPGYMSARVALGKIYLEKDMKAEARSEFEQVVISIPDNIFAQRKLADIYKDTGEVDLAIKQYEKVLELHPDDEEVQAIVRELKGEGPMPDEEPPQEVQGDKPSEEAGVSVGEAAGISVEGDADVSIEEAAGVSYEGEAEVSVEEAAKVSFEEEAGVSVGEAAEVSYEGEAGVSVEETAEVSYEGEAGVLIEEEHSAGIPISDLDNIEPPYSEEQMADGKVSEKSEEELESALEELSRPEDEEVAASSDQEVPDLDDADKSIQDGDYIKAFNIYKAHLAKDPDNMSVLQKLQELQGLMKLLGRENEMIEVKLESFLNKIKNHKDEFFRSS
jgi:tetratricopeptide (TPR) repeat protein